MEEKEKHYSVLMSVYYKERPSFLRESMQSMFNQTVPTDDFVLVCDGPLTDELDAVIGEMQDKYNKTLKVVRLSKNSGLGNALNIGVKACKNELIARMDSDDISMEYRIEKQLQVIAKTEADVVGSNTIEYNNNLTDRINNKIVPETDIEIKRYLKKRNPFNHMTVMFRKTKVLDAGNYQECEYFEDYYLWCRMAKRDNVFYNIQSPLVKVRAGESLISRRGGKKYNRTIINFQNSIRKIGVINNIQFAKNVCVRTIVSSFPSGLRSFFYKRVLRK